MNPIIREISPRIETQFRRTFQVTDFPTEIDEILTHADTVMWNNCEFTVHVELRNTDFYGVYLTPVGWTHPIRTMYSIRVTNQNGMIVSFGPIDKTFRNPTPNGWGSSIVPRTHLRTLYVKDDKFDVDIVFISAKRMLKSAKAVTIYRPPMKPLEFTDFTMKHGNLELPCNKTILARESEVLRRALSNDWTKESREAIFDVGHANATEENVRLFLQCICEDWSLSMEKHAFDLLMMAESYNFPKVVAAAIQSLERQLSDSRFWATCDMAVLLKVSCPTLLQVCAEYADRPGKLTELVGRNENNSPATSHELGKAIAKLN